jgi:hypothetical protein
MPPLRPIGIDRLLVNIQSAFQVVKCDPPTGIGHVVRQFLFPLRCRPGSNISDW